MSNYKRICEFINEFNRNDLFTRKELFEQCIEPYSENTIDQYRRVFEANNIIVKIKPGIYMKLHDIPEDITYTELVERAYGKASRAGIYSVFGKRVGTRTTRTEANPLYSSSQSIFDTL